MSQYQAIITLAGQNRIATALAGGAPLDLAGGQIAVGDAGGVTYTPAESQTQLVGERWRGPILSVSAQAGGLLVIAGRVPASSGGYRIRELGIFDATGTLIAVQPFPERLKPTPAQGAADDLEIYTEIDIGAEGVATLTLNPASQVPIPMLTRTPWISVDGFELSPPAGAQIGRLVIVAGPNPTGLFANRAHQLAELGPFGWLFTAVPVTSLIRTPDGVVHERTPTGWQPWRAGETAWGPVRLATASETASRTVGLAVASDKIGDGIVVTGAPGVFSRAVLFGRYVIMEGTATFVGPGPHTLTLPVAYSNDGYGFGAISADGSGRTVSANTFQAGSVVLTIANADGTAPGAAIPTTIKWTSASASV